jgi:hypothetical protein
MLAVLGAATFFPSRALAQITVAIDQPTANQLVASGPLSVTTMVTSSSAIRGNWNARDRSRPAATSRDRARGGTE